MPATVLRDPTPMLARRMPWLAVTGRRIAVQRALLAGMAGVTLAVVVNALVRTLAVTWGGVDPGYQPISMDSVLGFTALYCGAAAVLFWLFGRLGWGLAPFVLVAFTALVMSFGPDLMLLYRPELFPFRGTTPGAVGWLILMHLTAFGSVVLGLLRWGTEPAT